MTSVIRDTLNLAGFAAVLTGLWWIYPPLSLIIGGAALVGLGLLLRED